MSEILLDIHNGVATVTLNRPKRGNALNSSMQNTFRQHLESLRTDSSVHVVVITGSGKYFCTGMDLTASVQQEMRDDLNTNTNKETLERKGLEFFHSLLTFPKPTVAKLNGPAFGGGVGMMFCCDFRYLNENAFLTFSEVKRGILPALISSFILPQMSSFQAKQLMLSGERLSAADALRIGIVTTVVSPSKLDEAVERCISELMTSAPQAMASIKSLVHSYHTLPFSDFEKEAYLKFRKMMTSEEAIYGMASFASKETPDWTEFRAKL
jgi:methylglutaconyl-CoA hydratase